MDYQPILCSFGLNAWVSAIGRGCVKTFSSRFDGLHRDKNRASTQISGLLIDQVSADFK
jgi:hypothetical protein